MTVVSRGTVCGVTVIRRTVCSVTVVSRVTLCGMTVIRKTVCRVTVCGVTVVSSVYVE